MTLAWLLVIAAFALVTQAPALSGPWRVWIVDLAWMAAAAAAGARSLLTASRSQGSDRVAFALFGAASVVWALGMVIWNYHELLRGTPTPFPSLADVGFLLAAPLYAAGLIAYPPPAPRPGRFTIRAGNLGMLAAALTAVLLIELHDVLQASPHGYLYQFTALMWPTAFGIAAAFGLFAWTADVWGARRIVLRLLVFAIVFHALGALLYGEQLLLSRFATGGVIDVLWIVAFALEYAAAVEQDRLRGQGREGTAGEILTLPDVALPAVLIGVVMLVVLGSPRQAADVATWLVPLGLVFALSLSVRGWWMHRTGITIRATEADVLKRLASSEQRLRNVFETASDGLLLVDDDGRVHAANPAAATMLGSSTPALAERRLADLLGAEAAAAACAARSGQPVRRELMAGRPDGTSIPVHMTAARFADVVSGPAIGLTLQDLREQRAAEDARQAQARMAAISQVTAGVAHDFNNLLTVIIGHAETLRQDEAGEGRTDTEPLASGILAAAERCARLTRRLLAFSRQQPLLPETVNLQACSDRAVRQVALSASPAVRFVVEPLPQAVQALADRAQLEQAIVDLLHNAVEAMPDGGTVRVMVEAAEVRAGSAAHDAALPAGIYAVVRVADSGHGMGPDVLARAFEPFFTTKPFGLGAGLGLSTVQGFARQSSGHVDIASTPGLGTTVSIWLPRA